MKRLILVAAIALNASAFAPALGVAPALAASHSGGQSAAHGGGQPSGIHAAGRSGASDPTGGGDPTGIHGTGSSDGWAGCKTYSWECR